MHIYSADFIKKARQLRRDGQTYSEIQNKLGSKIPKSTLSYWCVDIPLPKGYNARIANLIEQGHAKGRAIALIANRKMREDYLEEIYSKNTYLARKLSSKDVGKLVLASLYLGEGAKKTSGCVLFGNSDPGIIQLFLKLLRDCYELDETKFRCTVQCRADQDVKSLENFWSKATKVPISKFYKANIDRRTIGKKTLKKEYKGVCRINYLSAHIYTELMTIGRIMTNKGPMV